MGIPVVWRYTDKLQSVICIAEHLHCVCGQLLQAMVE